MSFSGSSRSLLMFFSLLDFEDLIRGVSHPILPVFKESRLCRVRLGVAAVRLTLKSFICSQR